MAADGPSVLATPEQRLVEARAIEIYARPEIQAAKLETLAMFRADRNAKLIDQDALIAASVDEHYFHASLMAANENPADPRIVWTLTPRHQWMGLDVPGSRFGQDNTDNVYRYSSIDPAYRYTVTGRFTGQRPADFGVCALPAQMGENTLSPILAIISPDAIDVDADGRFEIAVDATPTEGRRNHLCIAGAKMLMIRDSLADWNVEKPSALLIERTDGAPEDRFDLAKAALRAAFLGGTIARYFLGHVQHGMCEANAVNTVPSPVSSAARGGLVTQSATLGYYRLGDDEAMIIEADRLGARYVGMEIVDMWMISYEYRHRTGSLNHLQAVPDSDGRYRWVISASDPGVNNWLDGGGAATGTIVMRWQHLPPGVELAGSVATRVVKLSDLRAALPPETRYLDAAGRAAQRKLRLDGAMSRVAWT
jgi:hypothetical protein